MFDSTSSYAADIIESKRWIYVSTTGKVYRSRLDSWKLDNPFLHGDLRGS